MERIRKAIHKRRFRRLNESRTPSLNVLTSTDESVTSDQELGATASVHEILDESVTSDQELGATASVHEILDESVTSDQDINEVEHLKDDDDHLVYTAVGRFRKHVYISHISEFTVAEHIRTSGVYKEERQIKADNIVGSITKNACHKCINCRNGYMYCKKLAEAQNDINILMQLCETYMLSNIVCNINRGKCNVCISIDSLRKEVELFNVTADNYYKACPYKPKRNTRSMSTDLDYTDVETLVEVVYGILTTEHDYRIETDPILSPMTVPDGKDIIRNRIITKNISGMPFKDINDILARLRYEFTPCYKCTICIDAIHFLGITVHAMNNSKVMRAFCVCDILKGKPCSILSAVCPSCKIADNLKKRSDIDLERVKAKFINCSAVREAKNKVTVPVSSLAHLLGEKRQVYNKYVVATDAEIKQRAMTYLTCDGHYFIRVNMNTTCEELGVEYTTDAVDKDHRATIFAVRKLITMNDMTRLDGRFVCRFCKEVFESESVETYIIKQGIEKSKEFNKTTDIEPYIPSAYGPDRKTLSAAYQEMAKQLNLREMYRPGKHLSNW
jgi:hypothetical protein